jgi:choline dehydrogenase
LKNYFDYIIIGAGSAGCVLADRLTESGEYTVLLIEAGGSNNSIFIQMPTALSYPMKNKKYNWLFESEPEPYLNGRVLHCPRGKGLGGSSSINGMVYVRGHACDFDEWEELGAKNWGYQNCLPYFRKSEHWIGESDEYRGDSGPLHTCNGNEMKKNPLYGAFIAAGIEAGYGYTKDYNGCRQEGFGPMHMTVKDGTRCSTAAAYLDQAKKRTNLTIITNSTVHKVLIKDKVAIGVEYSKDKEMFKVYSNKETILSAGAIGSPMLLQLSGIGPASVLKKANVEVILDLPGVGENLQDHLEVYFQYECKQPITLNAKLDTISKALIGIRWLLFKDGLGATNHFEACAFIRSKAGIKWPDIQYHFLPAAIRYDGDQAIKGHGFQVHVGPNKPKSRGSVQITSNNPFDKPSILFNYLEAKEDREAWRACIRLTREIMEQSAMTPYRGEMIQPNSSIQSNKDIDNWVRDNVESAYHPSCSCKMGAEDDNMTVVNSECQVIGVKNLRVVDSSIFPTITNGNLNAPTIMVAERASDMILGRDLLLSEPKLEVWIDPNWTVSQREKEKS